MIRHIRGHSNWQPPNIIYFVAVAVEESYLNKVASLIRSRRQCLLKRTANAVLCSVHSVDRINSVS